MTYGPAAQNDPFVPRSSGWRHRLNCLRHQSHDIVDVVVDLSVASVSDGVRLRHRQSTAHLDVEQQPDVLEAGAGQVPQQVHQARQGFVGFLERAQRAEIAPLAVDDTVRLAKTSLKGRVLVRQSARALLATCDRTRTRAREGPTWESTTTPSPDRCMSVSRACAPASSAPANALSVFSGKRARYPRCAIACGNRRPSLSCHGPGNGAEPKVVSGPSSR